MAVRAWPPNALANSLDYITPDYSNLFPDTSVQHNWENLRSAKVPRARAADVRNQEIYTQRMVPYNVLKAQREADEAARRANFDSRLTVFNEGAYKPGGYGWLDDGSWGQTARVPDLDAPRWYDPSKKDDKGQSPWVHKDTGQVTPEGASVTTSSRWEPSYTPLKFPNDAPKAPSNYENPLLALKAPSFVQTPPSSPGAIPPPSNSAPVFRPPRVVQQSTGLRPNYLGTGFLNAKPIKAPGS